MATGSLPLIKSGQFICYKSGQIYLLTTFVLKGRIQAEGQLMGKYESRVVEGRGGRRKNQEVVRSVAAASIDDQPNCPAAAAAFDADVELTAFPDLLEKGECFIRSSDCLAVYACNDVTGLQSYFPENAPGFE